MEIFFFKKKKAKKWNPQMTILVTIFYFFPFLLG